MLRPRNFTDDTTTGGPAKWADKRAYEAAICSIRLIERLDEASPSAIMVPGGMTYPEVLCSASFR
jgi:hypothetical protein